MTPHNYRQYPALLEYLQRRKSLTQGPSIINQQNFPNVRQVNTSVNTQEPPPNTKPMRSSELRENVTYSDLLNHKNNNNNNNNNDDIKENFKL